MADPMSNTNIFQQKKSIKMNLNVEKSISSIDQIFLHKNFSSQRGSIAQTMIGLPSVQSSQISYFDYGSFNKSFSARDSWAGSYSSYGGGKPTVDLFRYGLSQAEKVAVISVLEDTVDQLEILSHVLPEAYDRYDGYETLEERHGSKREKPSVGPDEGHSEARARLMKMQQDRAYVESVVVRTVMELEKNSTYEPLEEALQNYQQMEEDDAFLLEDTLANQDEVRRLKDELEMLQTGFKKAVDEAECAALQLQDKAHDTLVELGIRKRFVARWEKSRRDQRGLQDKNLETNLSEDIERMINDMDTENRANQEIETFINMSKQELEESIEQWMELYDRECDERDQAIAQLRMEREIHMRKLLEMQDTFEEHRKEMDDWLAIKEKRRIKAEAEAFLYKMATRIQAWWRGTMYRKKLGPYRKKKGKGKGKGNGKGAAANKKGGKKR